MPQPRPPLLLCGDSMEELEALPDNFVDAVVTDPPYGLNFMGRAWDYQVPGKALWQEVLRVMKPGAHLLAFFGSRTYHRGVVEIEDAGFEIRDCVMWVYSAGMPKGMNISKAIDREAGAERPIIGKKKKKDSFGDESVNKVYGTGPDHRGVMTITAPATAESAKWNGWNTQLKPAHEPIVLARKPFPGTVAGNVLAHGTGGLNIDGCRIGDEGGCKTTRPYEGGDSLHCYGKGLNDQRSPQIEGLGRWPANLIHDGSPDNLSLLGDAQRYYYCAKASKSDRGDGNGHPTVKPQALMRYLCRLITPPNGLILDPFMGSGSTGVAAVLEGFRFAGIDLDPDYVALSRRRIQQAIEEAASLCS